MAPTGAAERQHLDSLLRDRDCTQDVIERLFAEVTGGSSKLSFEQLQTLVPRAARELDVAEAAFPRDALEVYFQRFDFDGSGNLSAAETTKLFQRSLRRYRIDVFGPVSVVDVSQTTPKEAGYTFVRDLGAGGQGAMKLYRDHDGQFRCIKFYDKSQANAGGVEDLKDEYSLMKSIYSPHLAQTFDVFQDATFYYLVNEPYFGGDMRSFVRNATAQGVSVTESLWRSVFGQAITGLSHLHLNSVMHCDIKEPNIMVAEKDYHNPRVVLIDFGLATAFTGEALHVGGTPGYMPPETLGTMTWYPKGDVWSMGIVMFQLLTGKVPDPPVVNGIMQEGLIHAALQGIDPMDWIARNTREKDPPWDLLPTSMPLIHDLLWHMLQKPMALRATVHQCLGHPWLRKSDSDAPCNPEVVRALADIGHRSAAQEAAVELLIGRLSMAELGSLRDCFDAADTDGTGFLEPNEVKSLLHRCGIPENAHGIIVHALVGQEGRVGYQRFLHELLAKKALSDAQRLRELFDDLDAQKRGGLEVEVLQHMLQQECAEPSQAESLIAAMDLNHDGLVSFEELRRVIIDGRPPAEVGHQDQEPQPSPLGMASPRRPTATFGQGHFHAVPGQLVVESQQGVADVGLESFPPEPLLAPEVRVHPPALFPPAVDASVPLGDADAGAGSSKDDGFPSEPQKPASLEPCDGQCAGGAVGFGAVAAPAAPQLFLPPPLQTQPHALVHQRPQDASPVQPEPEWAELPEARAPFLSNSEASQVPMAAACAPARPPARTEEEPLAEADCVDTGEPALDNSIDSGSMLRLDSLARIMDEMLPNIKQRLASDSWSDSPEDAPAFAAIGLQDTAPACQGGSGEPRILGLGEVAMPLAKKQDAGEQHSFTPSTRSPDSSENSTPTQLLRQPGAEAATMGQQAHAPTPPAGAPQALGLPSCLSSTGSDRKKLKRRVSFKASGAEEAVYQVQAGQDLICADPAVVSYAPAAEQMGCAAAPATCVATLMQGEPAVPPLPSLDLRNGCAGVMGSPQPPADPRAWPSPQRGPSPGPDPRGCPPPQREQSMGPDPRSGPPPQRGQSPGPDPRGCPPPQRGQSPGPDPRGCPPPQREQSPEPAATPPVDTEIRRPAQPAAAKCGDGGKESPRGSTGPKLESLLSFLDDMLPSFSEGKLGTEEEKLLTQAMPVAPRKDPVPRNMAPQRQKAQAFNVFDEEPWKPTAQMAGRHDQQKRRHGRETDRRTASPVRVQKLSDFLASDEEKKPKGVAVAQGPVQRRRSSTLDNVVGKFLRRSSKEDLGRQFHPPERLAQQPRQLQQPPHLVPAVQRLQQGQQWQQAPARTPSSRRGSFALDERREGESMACLMDRLLPHLDSA